MIDYRDLFDDIKEKLKLFSFIIGIIIKTSFEEDQEIQLGLIILVSEEKHAPQVITAVTPWLTEHPMQLSIHSMDKLEKSLEEIFQEGKIIYWNSSEGFSAGQILHLKPFCLFTFTLEKLGQKEKVKFNYQIYGKSKPGILGQLEGKRLTKSCFLVPYENKFKMIRFLSKNNINFDNFGVWMEK